MAVKTIKDLAGELSSSSKEVKKAPSKTEGYDNSKTLWVNGPQGTEKWGNIQLRIPLEEFNLEYPDAGESKIGIRVAGKSYQAIMVYKEKTLLIGYYYPPQGWKLGDVKRNSDRTFGFHSNVIEIELDEGEELI